MNNRKGVIGLTLAAIMVASIFAVITPTIADVHPLAEIQLMKTTINCTTGAEEPLANYSLGDKVCYWMKITYPGTTNWTGNTYDIYPNGTIETLNTSLFLNAGENKSYYRNYTVTADDVARGYIINTFRVEGKDGLGDDASGSVEKNNTVIRGEPPVFEFDFVDACCFKMEFNGSASHDPDGSIVNHTWDFGDGNITGPISGAPGVIEHRYTACGDYTVKLSGYDDDELYNETSHSVHVDCGPTAIVKTPPCFEEGGTWITFNGSDSTYDTRPIVNYTWIFSDEPGVSYSGAVVSRWINDTVTATLTVDDGHCYSSYNVTVGPCPSRVPAITPMGIIALIGLLSAIAAISIISMNMNKRRRK